MLSYDSVTYMKKTKIDIFSGFLGAGKTTLIKKLIAEAYTGEKVVLIENEFGEIGIDGGFLKDAGIEITEMNSGCICCSLVGDFRAALAKVIDEYHPDRIIIEPSGVGKLSDVIRAASTADPEKAELNCFTTVADAGKCKMYMKNFGEFFNDQIEHASAIVLSHTDVVSAAKVEEAVALLRTHNAKATIVTTPWSELDGKTILAAMEQKDRLEDALELLAHEEEHHHHHHHDEDGDECCHGHHHDEDDDDEDECCHGHHHHDGEHCSCGHHHHDDHDEDEDEHEHHHDDDEDEDEHEHHHHDGEHCSCGHHHHHDHDADEVFGSFGAETTHTFTEEKLRDILSAFDEDHTYGMILRAKGIVPAEDGRWLHFDYVPGGIDIRYGAAGIIGRLCVIGSGIDRDALKTLFAL